MRWNLRTGALALALATLPAAARAQDNRLFTDAWFWGAKAGLLNYSTAVGSNLHAPTFGADWLITRTHAGLYVAFDAAPLSDFTNIPDPLNAGGVRNVTLSGFKRISFAATAFPTQYGRFRTYG